MLKWLRSLAVIVPNFNAEWEAYSDSWQSETNYITECHINSEYAANIPIF